MDRSPHLAILGAGPTGLEAALAAAAAGMSFTLYEVGDRIADSIRRWGHVRLFSPWDLDVSPRMRAALEKQGLEVPRGARCPTGRELIERVLEPVAGTPAIASCLELGTRILAIGREGLVKSQAIGDPARADHSFRLLLEAADGTRHTATADIVLDCTGTYDHPNATGDGGIPAPGEAELGDRIVRTLPDLAAEAEKWAGRRILLVGAGHSAHTAIADLAALAAGHPDTEILWAIRRRRPEWETLANDPLPSRAELVRWGQDLATGASPNVHCLPGVVVDSLAEDGDRIRVILRRHDGSRQEECVDRILSLTGFVGDHQLYRQLQVHECYATCGPMKLAASLLAASSSDCLDQTSHGVETLTNPEPGFFILGAKSYGRNSTYLMRIGWSQVDEIFGLLQAEAA